MAQWATLQLPRQDSSFYFTFVLVLSFVWFFGFSFIFGFDWGEVQGQRADARERGGTGIGKHDMKSSKDQ